jgi:L-alanine-DL-glutamate epimerase-like enolase superfamily enzyme
VRIAAIHAYPLSRPVRPDLAIVSAAGSHLVSNFAAVEVTGEDGTKGFGEATVVPVWSGESQARALHAINEIIAPALAGRDSRDASAAADIMDRLLIGNPFTKAAVEMAMLDLAGRELGVPAVVVLGGRRRTGPVRLKFSIGAFAPAEAARVARHAVGLGLTAIKIKVGARRKKRSRPFTGGAHRTRRRLPDRRGCEWRLDRGGDLCGASGARRIGSSGARATAARGDFRGTARIRRRTRIPVMLDESVFTQEDAIEAVRHDARDLISVYPGKNGGILKSLAIANIAAATGLQCVIGSNLEMEVGTAAMLALASAMPALSESVPHDIIGPLYYDGEPKAIHYEAGSAWIPAGPGLGLA